MDSTHTLTVVDKALKNRGLGENNTYSCAVCGLNLAESIEASQKNFVGETGENVALYVNRSFSICEQGMLAEGCLVCDNCSKDQQLFPQKPPMLKCCLCSNVPKSVIERLQPEQANFGPLIFVDPYCFHRDCMRYSSDWPSKDDEASSVNDNNHLVDAVGMRISRIERVLKRVRLEKETENQHGLDPVRCYFCNQINPSVLCSRLVHDSSAVVDLVAWGRSIPNESPLSQSNRKKQKRRRRKAHGMDFGKKSKKPKRFKPSPSASTEMPVCNKAHDNTADSPETAHHDFTRRYFHLPCARAVATGRFEQTSDKEGRQLQRFFCCEVRGNADCSSRSSGIYFDEREAGNDRISTVNDNSSDAGTSVPDSTISGAAYGSIMDLIGNCAADTRTVASTTHAEEEESSSVSNHHTNKNLTEFSNQNVHDANVADTMNDHVKIDACSTFAGLSKRKSSHSARQESVEPPSCAASELAKKRVVSTESMHTGVTGSMFPINSLNGVNKEVLVNVEESGTVLSSEDSSTSHVKELHLAMHRMPLPCTADVTVEGQRGRNTGSFNDAQQFSFSSASEKSVCPETQIQHGENGTLVDETSASVAGNRQKDKISSSKSQNTMYNSSREASVKTPLDKRVQIQSPASVKSTGGRASSDDLSQFTPGQRENRNKHDLSQNSVDATATPGQRVKHNMLSPASTGSTCSTPSQVVSKRAAISMSIVSSVTSEQHIMQKPDLIGTQTGMLATYCDWLKDNVHSIEQKLLLPLSNAILNERRLQLLGTWKRTHELGAALGKGPVCVDGHVRTQEHFGILKKYFASEYSRFLKESSEAINRDISREVKERMKLLEIFESS